MTGMRQLINKATRLKNIIDLVYTNSDYITNSSVFDVNISDHSLIFVTRKKKTLKHPTRSILARSYADYDKENYQSQLRALNSNDFYACENPNDAWQIFETNLRSIIDNMCPLKRVVIKDKGDPWVNN